MTSVVPRSSVPQVASEQGETPSVPPRRMQLPGIDLIRAIAVLTVIYSHISYYLIDDLHTGWWLIDWVYAVFVNAIGLNQHLSFLGVAFFMVVTGFLLTGSATRQKPMQFMVNRIARLVPSLWLTLVVAIVLVRLGINSLFSGQPTITNGQALLSFVFGGFFLDHQAVVLGVTWTLLVQIFFYVYCISARRVLQTKPILVPLAGGLFSGAVLIAYHFLVHNPAEVPILFKVAGTLPAIFVGQIIYLAWTGIADWRWVVAATLVQVEVVRLASGWDAYGAGVEHYLWTMAVVSAVVLLLATHGGPLAQARVVKWLATRSYAIYLVHTLVLYRAYDMTVGFFGKTGAIVVFLVIAGLCSEALYRWVEVPCAKWITGRYRARTERIAARSIEPCLGTTNSSEKLAQSR
ncbi:acyltransferase family protein [Antrihabitans cavernicola]|uniref:acyltransferase family protein n=1 Tax=Antrihabitans cavernicola TaxID=2495913 RepID=UPI001F394E4F|nr:acyltransferase [Spelaeibacter cavernicola]